jgi:hypothetical protein
MCKSKEFTKCKNFIENSKYPFFDKMRWILIARFDNIEKEEVMVELNNLNLNSDQIKFIFKWINNELNFVEIN